MAGPAIYSLQTGGNWCAPPFKTSRAEPAEPPVETGGSDPKPKTHRRDQNAPPQGLRPI